MSDGPGPGSRRVYHIRVEGALAETWSAWFDGIDMEQEMGEGGARTTVLTGALDHAALHGILDRIRDLNLKLISVTGSRGSSTPSPITHQNHPPGP